jgi:hypothetical protein
MAATLADYLDLRAVSSALRLRNPVVCGSRLHSSGKVGPAVPFDVCRTEAGWGELDSSAKWTLVGGQPIFFRTPSPSLPMGGIFEKLPSMQRLGAVMPTGVPPECVGAEDGHWTFFTVGAGILSVSSCMSYCP